MNIYVLDPETLDRLAVINTYSALSWNRVWGESGTFQIWAPVTEENEEFLTRENLIWPDDQDLVGVIDVVHKYTSEDSPMPVMEISGYFAERAYLQRRIIWGNILVKDTPAVVIRKIIRENASACDDTNRRLGPAIQKGVAIEDSVPVQSDITYCNSYGNVWEEVKGISLEHNLNTSLILSGSSLSFVVSSAQDRSSVVNLSTDLGFLTDSDYTCDSSDYCNTALIAGEGEGADRITTSIIPQAVQRDRRELYVDARDLRKTSADSQEPMSDEVYLEALVQRGSKKLLDHPLYQSYECSLQITGEEGYRFGEDYFLGDVITLTDSVLKVQIKAAVKEHQIYEDKDGRTDVLVFGLAIPTITALVKRRN